MESAKQPTRRNGKQYSTLAFHLLSPSLSLSPSLTYFCPLFNISYFSMSRAAVAIGTFTWLSLTFFSVAVSVSLSVFFHVLLFADFNFPPGPLSSSLTQFELCGLTVGVYNRWRDRERALSICTYVHIYCKFFMLCSVI